MILWEWVRFFFSALFLVGGLFVLTIATLGIYRFDHVLTRIHVAAKCDTLGILLVILGLIFRGVPLFSALKMLLVIAFMWLAGPVSSHLIVRLEVITGKKTDEKGREVLDESV